MYKWLLILLLLWPLVWLLRVLAATRVLLGLEIRRETVEPLAPEAVPSHFCEAIQSLKQQLELRGFSWLGGWRVRRFQDASFDEVHAVFAHPEIPVRAVVQPHRSPALSGRCWLNFRSTTAEGVELITSSFEPEQLFPPCPAIETQYRITDAVGVLWDHHLQRITPLLARGWTCTDIENAARREQYLCDASHAHLSPRADFMPRPEGALSYRPGAAWREAVRLVRGARARRAFERDLLEVAAPTRLSAAAQLAFDLQQYRQFRFLSTSWMALGTKSILAVISLAAFAGVLAWTTSPVVAASVLAGALIHEAGHVLGMRWFGLRQPEVLFIPVLAGAGIAQDDKVRPSWQHVAILLLGPLPGIFLGSGLVIAGGAAGVMATAGATLIALNLLTLVPILPLDGARIADVAVPSRFPRARIAFASLSVLGLLLVATGLESFPLQVLGMLMVLRLPAEWRMALARAEVQPQLAAGFDEEMVVRPLLLRIRAPDWANVSTLQRLASVQHLQRVLRMPKPGFGTLCFAAIGFTAPLWGAVPFLIWSEYRPDPPIVQLPKQES